MKTSSLPASSSAPRPGSARAPQKTSVSRLGCLCAAGLLAGIFGWWLHGPALREAPAIASGPVLAARPAPKPVSPAPVPLTAGQVTAVMERAFTVDSDDMVLLIEELGALTRLSDAEIRGAWEQLAGRQPTRTFGGSLTAMYLWSRMARMGENVELPAGWGTEEFAVAIDSEIARRNTADILRRLEAGEAVSDVERRVVFTQLMRSDPVAAIDRWCQATLPDAYLSDAKLMGKALADPRTREAVMVRLRAWQKDRNGNGPIGVLTQSWIDRDPAEVERWAMQPEQADVRDGILFQLANARAVTSPLEAWEWSKSLPEERRLQTLNVSASQLANRGPESAKAGMELIAGLAKPAERREAIQGFAPTLAANDPEQWRQWRDTLPAADRDLANEAAFPYWIKTDAGKAAAWLDTVSAGPSRDMLINTLVFHCAKDDPEAAVKWIRTISDPVRRKEAVTAALSSGETQTIQTIRAFLAAAE